ncbi:hypothetical protein DYQ86_20820 [Acidobacteria bacterium AB60]|nr:hypothetical protein DYQ86_20820 [Acidobacteria bacterium AB60]
MSVVQATRERARGYTGLRAEFLDRGREEAAGWGAFAALSVVYFVAVAALSWTKLLWLDELITLHIARLPDARAIWQALAAGADPNPPLTHLLVHGMRKVLGDHAFAYRLPAMAGYWVGLISLFAYLRKRVPGRWALAGTVTSMCMGAFEYSYESRSYGIFYGLAMLAFLCWTRTVDADVRGARRAVALAGMTLALAAGISTNYFAVLAFFPIAMGEAARTIVKARAGEPGARAAWRMVDWRIWIALAIAGSPLLLYRPLIAHAIAQFAPYAWNKVSLDQVADSYTEMVEIILYPILVLGVFAAGAAFGKKVFAGGAGERSRDKSGEGSWREGDRERALGLQIPWHEAVGVLGFVLYPILGYVVASIRGGMLSPRFVIPVCFGFAIAATLMAFRLFGTMRRASLVFLCFVMAWFLSRESVIGYWYMEQKECLYKILDGLPQALAELAPDAPIAVPDSLLAMTFVHYAPEAIAKRVVVPLDFPAIRYYRHDDSPEENLWAGRGTVYSTTIEPVAQFAQTGRDYLVIANENSWYFKDLSQHHFRYRRLPLETRATELGGFTPLARGTPEFFASSWEQGPAETTPPADPIPFEEGDELPRSSAMALSALNRLQLGAWR